MKMVEKLFLLSFNEMNVGDAWFRQDGATVNTFRTAMCIAGIHFQASDLIERYSHSVES